MPKNWVSKNRLSQKEELVYKILDEQAIAGATKKVAADKLKEEHKGDKQKRSRVTVKKEAADKVFTANKNGELTKGKTEEAPAVQASVQAAEAAKEPAVATTPAAETEVPKRKPGRPRKVKQEAAPVAETPKTVPAETKVETTEPKKQNPRKLLQPPSLHRMKVLSCRKQRMTLSPSRICQPKNRTAVRAHR